MRPPSLALLLLAAAACSHSQLSGADLDRVQHPAYVGRVAEGAGPKAPATSAGQAKEVAAMNAAISRFEMSERLRSQLSSALRTEKPWSGAVPAAKVASALETFLVEQVPAVPPDYTRLKPLGADSVVELVIEDFGLRSESGSGQTYVRGTARMFLLADGTELWRTSFQRTGPEQGLPALEPAAVVTDAAPYGVQMRALLDAAAAGLAQDLSPPGRLGGRPTPTGTGELSAPADAPTKTEEEIKKARPPAPDLTAPANTPAPTDRSAPKPSKAQPAPDLTPPSELPATPKQP